MMLGDMLAAARNSASHFQAWLEASDRELAEAVCKSAEREGLGPASWVRSAVADFSALASEEDWATLTSAMRDSEDPGTACLLAMVHWRLSAPDCGTHGAPVAKVSL